MILYYGRAESGDMALVIVVHHCKFVVSQNERETVAPDTLCAQL